MSLSRDDQGEERRKHWRDRRSGAERRNAERNRHDDYECRSGLPRRESDLAGDPGDGDVYWDVPSAHS